MAHLGSTELIHSFREPGHSSGHGGGTQMLRALTVFAMAFCLFTSGIPQICGQESKSETPADTGELTVQASCSKVSLGKGIAVVSWSGARVGANKQHAPNSNQLEVTTVKDGFATGAAVTVWPNAAKSIEALSTSDHRLDPLRGLRLSISAKSQGGRAPGTATGPVTIQNLSPGVNYFWRVQTRIDGKMVPSNVVMTTAPVCPVDYKRK